MGGGGGRGAPRVWCSVRCAGSSPARTASPSLRAARTRASSAPCPSSRASLVGSSKEWKEDHCAGTPRLRSSVATSPAPMSFVVPRTRPPSVLLPSTSNPCAHARSSAPCRHAMLGARPLPSNRRARTPACRSRGDSTICWHRHPHAHCLPTSAWEKKSTSPLHGALHSRRVRTPGACACSSAARSSAPTPSSRTPGELSASKP